MTVRARAPGDLLEYVGADPESLRLAEQIDWGRLPQHIAIIMDGNGRWASERGLGRSEGHHAGVNAVREAVETCTRAGLEALTLFAFSMENWGRPQDEVDTLMDLCRTYVKKELPNIHQQGIRFGTIGRLEELPEGVRQDVELAAAATAANTGLHFTIAISYGSRAEIVDAARAIARAVAAGELREETLDEERFGDYLYTAALPDPDLLIRTSGELRVSNFLLYQIAYAEIWVTDKLWPDFQRADMLRAIVDFQRRDRRFGVGTDDVGSAVRADPKVGASP